MAAIDHNNNPLTYVAAAARVCSQDLGGGWWYVCNLSNNTEIKYVIENDFAE